MNTVEIIDTLAIDLEEALEKLGYAEFMVFNEYHEEYIDDNASMYVKGKIRGFLECLAIQKKITTYEKGILFEHFTKVEQ